MDWLVEFVVGELYARARLDIAQPCGAVRVAMAILGSHCMRVVSPRSIPGNAALAWGPHGATMYIRDRLRPHQVNVAVAHELAEWKLRLWDYVAEDSEELARQIASALCVPRAAFDRARKDLGDSIHALSRRFGVSRALMALRFA
ncbi:MAG: ImmA/IrrE family metallo-endopeptidase, partial [Nitrospirota bacterium]